jgi:hypothetical protein
MAGPAGARVFETPFPPRLYRAPCRHARARAPARAHAYENPRWHLGPQRVGVWVQVGGTRFPHIHTYILHGQAGPSCTQLQIVDLLVLELNILNFYLFFDFPPAKTVLSTRSSKRPKSYPINIYFFLE